MLKVTYKYIKYIMKLWNWTGIETKGFERGHRLPLCTFTARFEQMNMLFQYIEE